MSSKENIIKTSKGFFLPLFTYLILLTTLPSFAGWEIDYIDKFEGSSVNWENWTAQIDANFNNEVQCYTDDDSSANKNFDVSNGTLKIIARKQQVNCAGLNNQSRSWTSGRINGKDKKEFLYGRIEARIRFHNLEGGTWPAFWMLENRIAESPRANDNDFSHWPNPGAGEIDVWEWFANSPTTYITNFFNTDNPKCGSEVRYNYPNGANDVLNWHDYAIQWNENTIAFYIDDTLVRSHNVSNCQQYKEPMFVLLNVAIGGDLGGSIDPSLNKATMEVDYLAHCNPTNANTATRCNESTPEAFADNDNDGVANDIDQCPSTPSGATVNEVGCSEDQLAQDDDNDGVNNDIDQCPNTDRGLSVNTQGCAENQLDDDNDGVSNDIDQCPNTNSGLSVNAQGCAENQLDDDNDGVSNDIDQCPNTNSGLSVNAQGCAENQLDDDNDGVSNDIDQCPNTDRGLSVNTQGCSENQLDDDNDGVSNDIDQCPNTNSGLSVNAQGCAENQLDDDNDGVSNDIDQCPNSTNGASVDNNGCQVQTNTNAGNTGSSGGSFFYLLPWMLLLVSRKSWYFK